MCVCGECGHRKKGRVCCVSVFVVVAGQSVKSIVYTDAVVPLCILARFCQAYTPTTTTMYARILLSKRLKALQFKNLWVMKLLYKFVKSAVYISF